MAEPDIEQWRAEARDWLASVLPKRSDHSDTASDYAVFANISEEAEHAMLDRVRAYGLLLARTDPDVAKQAGLTMFLIPMDAPGVEIRPIRQMSGASSFNEVFLSDVRVGDDMRVGPIGEGWKVANATLGFERTASGQ